MPTNSGTGAAMVPGVSVSESRPARPAPAGVVSLSSSTDAANDIRYNPTNVEVWDAWSQIYTISTSHTGTALTASTVHQIQASLNAMAHQAYVNGNVWTAWNVSYVGSTVVVGPAVATTATTSATTNVFTTDATWLEWIRVQDAARAAEVARIGRQTAARVEPTAEQRERWRQEEARRRDEQNRLLREENAAKDKAIVLLKSCLTPQQLEEYEKKKHFHLHVGDRVYRIEQGSHGNVKLIDKDGKIKRSFCIQPRGVPEGDAMLAQKLLLQTDEKAFYESANVTEYDHEGRHLGTFNGPRAVDRLRQDQQRVG